MSDNAFSKHEASRVLNNRERYDPLLDSVVDWNDKRHLKRYQFANELISKSDTVLDIACGTGYGLDLISHNCLKGF